MLRVLVGETGLPEEVRVLEGARRDLTDAAVEAVRQWRFEPATRAGSVVRAWTEVAIPFEAIPFPPPTRTPSPRAQVPPVSIPTLIPDRAAPTVARPTPVPPPAVSPARVETFPPPEIPDPAPPEQTSLRGRPAITVYRTLRAARLAISPDQARITVDGKYVGIADDWDGHGGGTDFPLWGKGAHRIHAELPGYEALDIEVDVTAGAEGDIVEVDERLERVANRAYVRLPAVDARTRGAVEFRVDPPDATVSSRGRILGSAASFDASRPLELSGPAVHDLVVSAPGRRPRSLRVLVSSDAGEPRAVVSMRLTPRP